LHSGFSTFWRVCWSVPETTCLVLRLRSSMLLGWLLYILSLRNPHRRKSGVVRSGDHGGQSPHLTMQWVKKSSKKAVLFTVFAFPHIAEASDPVQPRIFCMIINCVYTKFVFFSSSSWIITINLKANKNSCMAVILFLTFCKNIILTNIIFFFPRSFTIHNFRITI